MNLITRKESARKTFRNLLHDDRAFVRDVAKRNLIILDGEIADLGRQSTYNRTSSRQSKAPAQPGLEKDFYLFLVSIILLALVALAPRISKSKPGSEWHSASYHEVAR